MNYKQIVVIVGVGLLVCTCGPKKKIQPMQESYTVKRVDLLDVMSQTGEVRPVIKIDLKSEASGKIEKIYVREGQRVARGQKILDIDPSRLNIAKNRLDLAVKRAAIMKKIALRNFEDATTLAKSSAVSEKQVTDLKNQLDLAEIEYRQQMLELDDITDQLNKTNVTSPMEGVITSLDAKEGEIAVSATSGFQGGTAIATIADVKNLEVVSQIGEVDFVRLQVGQKVHLKPEALENQATQGTITFIALSAKKAKPEDLGTFEVRISVDSIIPGIAPGVNVNVDFVIFEKKDVLGAPFFYVKKENDRAFVQQQTQKDPHKPFLKRIPVTLGNTDYKFYEILSGLNEGDVIVLRDTIATQSKGGPSRRH
jgi:HlyD family secretion protein